MEKVYKILKYFLVLITSVILMCFGYISSTMETGFRTIFYFIYKINENFDNINVLIFFEIFEHVISFIGFILFIYIVIKILSLLKE